MLLALVLTVTLSPPAALAAGGDCPPGQTNCDVWDNDPGTPGNPGGGGDTGGGGSGSDGPRKCTWNGQPVRCYDDVLGWFNNSDGCYYKLAEPQPEDTPDGKKWYVKTCDAGNSTQQLVLLDSPPGGFGAPPDPAELAAEALASLTLDIPPIGIAPKPANGPGLVGLPIWLWTSSAQTNWGPQSAHATDRTVTVWITAQVTKAVWDMGNGDKVTCNTYGVRYTGQSGPPPCGYAGYPRSSGDGKYRITVTTYWTVDWRANSGEHGTISTTRVSRPVWIEIDELQVVTK
jgi:hypothetical protein